MNDRIPILLDTDIGDDIDDALALVYLLKHPRCELLGVTTVFGDPVERARLADAVCIAAGCTDVPIHAGAPGTLRNPRSNPHRRVPQAVVLERWEHRREWAPGTAVEFMYETIASRKGRVVLLSIGPLTNVARLFSHHPEAAGMLAGYYLMGGAFGHGRFGEGPEWNTRADADATQVAYAAPVRRHVSVGLDVTKQCVIPAAEARRRLSGPALDIVAEMAAVWFGRRDEIVLHDPLAAALVFEPNLCTLKTGRVEMDVERGMTKFSGDEGGPHQVAVDVRSETFVKHFFEVVRGN